MTVAIDWANFNIATNNTISNGDEFTITANSSNSSNQVVIKRNGIEFTIDLNNNGTIETNEIFKITNNKIIDLGSYKD
jgi:hypothetical protein